MKLLFTTLPTNDLGLMTRSLPIAQELAARGYGSCQTSLWAGKPSVIIPTFSERLSNAKRLERVGAAILVEPTIDRGRKRVASDELRRAVATALADLRYRQNARSTREQLASLGGAKRAADCIEALGRRF